MTTALQSPLPAITEVARPVTTGSMVTRLTAAPILPERSWRAPRHSAAHGRRSSYRPRRRDVLLMRAATATLAVTGGALVAGLLLLG
jgi:hypothetical protein